MGKASGQATAFYGFQAEAKLILFSVLAVGLFLAEDPWRVAGLVAYLFLGLALARVPWRMLGRRLVPLLWFLGITGVAQVLLTRGRVLAEGPWGWPKITAEGLEAGLLLSMRVVALVGLSLWLTRTTPMAELASAAARCLAPLGRLRVPVKDLARMAILALRFVPELLGEGRRVLVAMHLRGLTRREGLWTMASRMLPLMVPVFTASFRRSQPVAAALEARGFGLRPLAPPGPWQWQEVVAVVLTAGLVTACWLWP